MNNMNIDTSSKVSTTTRTTSSSTQTRNSSSTGFADELSSMSSQKSEETKDAKKTSEADKKAADKAEGTKEEGKETSSDNMDEVIDGLEVAVAEINNKLNQTDEKWAEEFQNDKEFADTINNPNFSVGLNSQDPNAALAFQMNSGLNFNNENQQKQQINQNEETVLFYFVGIINLAILIIH